MAAAHARIAQAEASAEGALATFDGTWLVALRDTETALTNYVALARRVDTLRRARGQSAEAARIARLRYRAGAESFQIVLDAERELAQSEALLAAAQAQYSDATVTLFLASAAAAAAGGCARRPGAAPHYWLASTRRRLSG